MNRLLHFNSKVILVIIIFCGFGQDLNSQCPPGQYPNDLVQAGFHNVLYKTQSGYAFNGRYSAPNGTSSLNVVTEISTPNGYAVPPGVLLTFGSLGDHANSQYLFLGSDNVIYSHGGTGVWNNGQAATFGPLGVSLPLGIGSSDVVRWKATTGCLVFQTNNGDIYLGGNSAGNYQSGAGTSGFSLLQLPIGVSSIDFALADGTLLIYGSNGMFYTSGSIYLGNGTIATTATTPQLMMSPLISGGVVQIETSTESYFVLDGNGEIHVLGKNTTGNLGVGNTVNLTSWAKVGASCSGGVLSNVAFISTTSHVNTGTDGAGAILDNGDLLLWGSNSANMAAPFPVPPNQFPITCPSSTCADAQVLNSYDPIYLNVGSHVSPYINTSGQLCNVGHNAEGAYGDGTSSDRNCYECLDFPGGIPICGGMNANPSIPLLACNDNIQVSLDDSCEFELNVDILLEGDVRPHPCLIIQIKDESGDVIASGANPMLDSSYIDRCFEYAVVDTCTGNSCWGEFCVEDKLPPQFDCDPYDTVWCSNTKYVLPLDSVYEACGTYERVIVSDVAENYPCDSACAGKRWVTYYYVDESGNRSPECVKEVCYRRATLSDVVIPSDTIFDCLEFVDSHPNRTGWPQVGGYDITPDAYFCEVNCDYEDQIIDVCPGTQKTLRKWTCYDWCMPTGPENPRITWQVIKVLDEDGPIVYCPTTDDYRDTIGTNPWSCTGNTVLPEPHLLLPGQPIIDSSSVYILSECSEVDYSVRHLAATSPDDCTPDQNALANQDHVRYNSRTGRWEAFDLPLGCNWFYYTFTDECGNSSECTFDIYVEDDVPPIAVCDAHTEVTLTNDGTARAFALTFDDNSIDNCAVDSMDVRRMTSDCADSTTQFGPYVAFCCLDIGETVMVEFRVFDAAGNSNTCMVEVTVNDKEAPVLYPPPNITVDCRFEYDTSDLSESFGKVVIDESWRKPIIVKDEHYAPDYFAGLDGWATDNCDDVVIEMTPEYDLICGIGTIRRTWTATDPQGLTDSEVQIITIVDRDTFGFDDIKWPIDVTLTGCVGIDTDTSKTGVPSYNNVDCAHLAATYKDLVYDQIPDACYKIERKWTVVDWCAFDLGYPVWQWYHTQIIKVTDEEDPFFIECADTVFCDEGAYLENGQCLGGVDLSPQVGDKCTPTDLLRLRYRIDAFDSGTYGPWTPGDRVQGDYPVGSHRIQWEVEDGCGNSARCDYIFEVKDCKAPTPYCRSGIITVLMEGVGTISVWASDLDIGSFDNCTDTSNLIFSFDSLGKETSRTYTCDSMNGQWKIQKTVRMYVTDECGNVDYCETIIELQDNQKCIGSLIRLEGDVRNENGEPVADVEVRALNVSTNQVTYTTTTDANGHYEFDKVVAGRGYIIEPKYNEDHLNGVYTKDITIIQRDLLGMKDLESAYKVYAADANYNQDVGVSDISEIRKLILGKREEFTRNESWRFLKSDYAMTDIRDPWNAPQRRELAFVDSDISGLDFIAVKTGDVDNDAELLNGNVTRNYPGDYQMSYEIQPMDGGDLYEVRFFGDVASGLTSFQATLEFGQAIEIDEVFGAECNFTMEHVGDQWSDGGQVSVAWSTAEEVSAGHNELFTILVRASNLSTIAISDAVTRSVAYDQDLNGKTLVLRGEEDPQNGSFTLMQNIPNPFTGSTLIGFELPRSQEFILSFYSASGEMLKVIEGYGSKGMNEIRVGQSDFPSHSGTVIFYQLDTDNQSATRKLIMMK